MDVSDHVKQVPRHPGSLESNSFFVGFEDGLTPVDSVDRVDVLLV